MIRELFATVGLDLLFTAAKWFGIVLGIAAAVWITAGLTWIAFNREDSRNLDEKGRRVVTERDHWKAEAEKWKALSDHKDADLAAVAAISVKGKE